MFDIRLNDKKILSFGNPTFDYFKEEGLEHEKLAAKLLKENNDYATILMYCEHLHDDLWDDPNYCKHETTIICSEVEEEARNRVRYMDIKETHEVLKANNCVFTKNNLGDKQANNSHLCKLEDYVFEAQAHALFSEIIAEKKNEFRWGWDEKKKKEYRRTKEEIEKEWPRELIRILSPRTATKFERVFNIPYPLNIWDSRNAWQQFYFIKSNKDGVIYWTKGGSGSSNQRETQGRMAHTFATLHTKKKEITTLVVKYNKYNELILLESLDTLRIINGELSGNYQVSLSKTKHLFKNILYDFDYEERCFTQTEHDLVY